MNRELFQLLDFPLDGLHLIEASAGTGKTFSLAGLYLRLLIEKRLDVRRILVMTFTKAATQELRERIRSRITAAAVIAADSERDETGDAEHDIAVQLIARAAADEPREQIARRLHDAAACMDDATIATIHGFAQLAAQENAFDSGLPFDRGTQVDDPAVHRQAVTDYWRSQVLGRPAREARAFVELWAEPGKLYEDLKAPLERPYLDIRHAAHDTMAHLSERAQTLWNSEHQALQDVLETAAAGKRLLKNEPLNQAIVAHGGVPALMDHLEAGLAGTASGHPVLPVWIADLTTDEGVRKHARKNAQKTFRPQDLDLTHALAALAPAGRIAALEAAFLTVRDSVRQRKRDARQFSFADLIEQLHMAVTDPVRGAILARALRRAWPYALVDEFQDTDPQQYDILRAIYRPGEHAAAGGLTMIGDPKQAIFAFRGGDVFAYLQAAREAGGLYDLGINYRSSQGVLDGIEALFSGAAAATGDGEFLVPDIRFQPVTSGRQPDDRVLLKDGERIPPVTAWSLPGDTNKADDARSMLIDATVNEIYALLDPANGARMRRSDGSEAPVQPSDIAVLVSRNADAAEVQRALARRGIVSVCMQPDSVFATDEARDLLYLLRAADSAARPETVRAALATPLFGLRMRDLAALTETDAGWHRETARFQDAHETWRSRGVLPMLEPILQAAAPRILALVDGERRMTNYLQLAELLACAEAETFGFAGLIHWLTDQIAHPEPQAEVDSQQLRLESDDELVRITTVHRAKGLEYAIVFAPFTPFLGAREQKHPLVYHDADGRAWLDFSLDDDNQPIANRESRAEALRLLYVALTRAKDACYLAWGSVNGAQNAALAWLLHADDGVAPGEARRGTAPPWLTAASARQRLNEFAGRCRSTVRVTDLPPALAEGFRVQPADAPQGGARDDLPARRPAWSVFSFSRLVAGGTRTADRGAEDESLDPAPEQLPTTGPAIPLHGPAFGTAIHLLLESLPDPAAWPGPDDKLTDTERAVAARHLQNAGLPLGDDAARRTLLDAVCRLVARTLYTPLPDIGPLARVPAGRRLVEMEFFLKLGGERIGRVLELLSEHGYAVTLPPERAARTLSGLMQGYVDLTVEANGRYWIVDYKTNLLGPAAADYRGDALARAVRHGHYDLQYLIYLVALHRHLGRTLPDYDPARHLGGAQYLFLRGLDGAGADTGVFVDRPPADFMVALDARFAGGAVTA